MYDEYERAVGAQSGSRISLLGWLGIAAVMVSLVGATGAFFAYRYVKGQVEEITSQLRPLESLVAMETSPMVAEVVSRTLAAASGGERIETGEVREAISRALDAPARASTSEGDATSRSLESAPRPSQSTSDAIEGSLRIRTGEGDFTADLDADGERGRLVVRRPGGGVIVDLSADEDGGRFVLRIDGEEILVEAGDRASRQAPAWTVEASRSPRDARALLSGRIDEADFGALTWTTADDPEALTARFRASLAEAGWRVEAEHDLRDGRSSSASTVARHDATGRILVFAAGRDDGVTTVVQGWAEKRR